ncbi:MAG: serine/threonine protein kinase [Deltaproteobacteria bacterium]|nr:MAG: serine/threonine protein kinase [Deltaproteobacteria bacterium]
MIYETVSRIFLNVSPETEENNTFGQYQLLEKIAQGGMAEIFRGKALDFQGLERQVVIKRILPHIAASQEFVQMLIDEAKIAVMLNHGNIAQVYDLGKVGDDYFIVMEFVEGKTISQIMKRLKIVGQPMPIAFAMAICAEIANGLDYMHRKTDDEGHPLHIVHRDISPQNVILSVYGTVKIIDFGIAKAKNKVTVTDSGVLKGKFAYMSPEHAEGLKLDHRNDIFSLGVILYELLTSERLFKGKNNQETVKRVKKARVPLPSERRPEIPKALDDIVLKALSRDRNQRYQSAGDFSRDLHRLLIQIATDYSPQQLVEFLYDLFPENAPETYKEQLSHEKTPSSPLIISQTRNRDSEMLEETIAADTSILKQKMKETAVYGDDLEKTEQEELTSALETTNHQFSDSALTKLETSQNSNDEEHTSQIMRRSFMGQILQKARDVKSHWFKKI